MKQIPPFRNRRDVFYLVHEEPTKESKNGIYIVKPKDNSYRAIWAVVWDVPLKLMSTSDGYTKEEVDKIISTIKDYQKENDKLLENIKLEISKLDSKKADRTELANVVAGLVPMGSVANLAELETKPKRSNDAYYVEDQLSPEGNAYIYRWDAGLNLWVNTKQVVFKYVITQGLGDSSNKVMSQKAVTDDLILKANHGYDSNPKTLKEVDDKLADLGLDSSNLYNYFQMFIGTREGSIPIASTLSISTNLTTRAYFYENFSILRGAHITKIRIDCLTAGTASIIKATGVNTSAYSSSILDTFTLVVGLNEFDVDYNLDTTETIGIGAPTDTAFFNYKSGTPNPVGGGLVGYRYSDGDWIRFDNDLCLGIDFKNYTVQSGLINDISQRLDVLKSESAKILDKEYYAAVVSKNRSETAYVDNSNNGRLVVTGADYIYKEVLFYGDIIEFKINDGYHFLTLRTDGNGNSLAIDVRGNFGNKIVNFTTNNTYDDVVTNLNLYTISLGDVVKVFRDGSNFYFYVNGVYKAEIDLNVYSDLYQNYQFGLNIRGGQDNVNSIYVEAHQYSNLHGLNISIIGDSISTYDYANLLPAQSYHDLIAKWGLMTKYVDAISGTPICTPDVNNFLTPSRWQGLGAAFDPDIIIVQGGTNDALFDNKQLGDIYSTNTDEFYGALKQLYENLLSTYPAAKIFHMTPPQNLASVFPRKNTTTGHYLYEFVNAIKEVAHIYGVSVIDIYAESGINNWNGASYLPDNTHPNADGHRKIAEVVFRDLLEKVKRN